MFVNVTLSSLQLQCSDAKTKLQIHNFTNTKIQKHTHAQKVDTFTLGES